MPILIGDIQTILILINKNINKFQTKLKIFKIQNLNLKILKFILNFKNKIN